MYTRGRASCMMAALGGTTSLVQEAIPREYHRKVLKKIAQLTKVIYALNTKNDEHEDFVQNLRSLHEAEVQQLLADSSSRLQKYQDEFTREREGKERRVEELQRNLCEVKRDEKVLQETQVSYRREVGERLSTLKSEHTQQVQQLTKELQRLKSDQTKQLDELKKLQDDFSKKSEEKLKVLQSKHKSELSELSEKSRKELKRLETELGALREDHQKQLEGLNKQHTAELEAQREAISRAQHELLSNESRKWQEKEQTLYKQFAETEESLKQQISSLSNELRVTKDKFALSEQRVKELELHCEDSKVDSSSLKSRLQNAESEAEGLGATVRMLQSELEIAREQYKQQSAEMQRLTVSLSKLEAIRVSHEGEIRELQSQVAGQQEKLLSLDREREALHNSQKTASEQQASKAKALEKELERVTREKQELHAQYAREIEAALAQQGQTETELGKEHIRALQNMKNQHQLALEEARREKEAALEELRQHLEVTARHEIDSIVAKHLSEISNLQEALSSKTSELNAVREELEHQRRVVAEREKGLGSASNDVVRLKAELGQTQDEMRGVKKELEAARRESSQLKSSVDSLQAELTKAWLDHQEEVQKVKATLTLQLEQKWMQRIKDECGSLREELSQRHSEDSRTALTELASLKDTALMEAKEQWKRDRDGLVRKIEELESQLQEMQFKTTVSMEETRSSAEEQISMLRAQLERKKANHDQNVEEMRQTHHHQMEALQQQLEEDNKVQMEELSTQHQSELQLVCQANQVAVSALRDQMEKQGREQLRQAAESHKEEIAALHADLLSQHESDQARMRDEHQSEMERHRQQMQDVISQRHRETGGYESTIESLRGEVGKRDSELSQLRHNVNSLTVIVSDLRKELEVKGQEVFAIKREANNQIHLRERQLVTSHQAEVESLTSQHKHQSQLLLADFNRAKEMLNIRIHELEKQLAEAERRYRSRDSKPEDLDTIKELKLIVQEQEHKMKELIAEKRIYQLELMNREKNYNKLFSANPHVGIMDPLQFKKKGVSASLAQRHASAPSLVSTGADLSPHVPAGTMDGSSSKTKRPGETRPRKLVALKDSPLSQQKFSKGRTLNPHSAPLPPTPSSVSPPKHTMQVVQ